MEFTPRELQICNLIKRAWLNKQIAHELKLTEGTVKEYLNRIYRKTGARNRTDLAMKMVMLDINKQRIAEMFD